MPSLSEKQRRQAGAFSIKFIILVLLSGPPQAKRKFLGVWAMRSERVQQLTAICMRSQGLTTFDILVHDCLSLAQPCLLEIEFECSAWGTWDWEVQLEA